MSDGHSDSARYSRFYEASKKLEEEKTESKIKKMCVVLKDNTIVSLDGVQLLYSEKYDKTVNEFSTELLSENGSRMMNLSELVRYMIQKRMV